MTPPRCIEKGVSFFVSVSAVNHGFRFAPKKDVVDTILYAFALKVAKYRNEGKILLHEFEFLSNHFHMVGTDVEGCLPALMEELDSLISRAINALRPGMRGRNFEGYNVVAVTGDEKLIEYCVYTQNQAVAARLVDRTREWKHVSSRKLEYGVPLLVHRPKTGLWKPKVRHIDSQTSKRSKRARYSTRSRLPEVVELVIDRPPVRPDLSDTELRALIRAKAKKAEMKIRRDRKKKGQGVLGWPKAVATHFLSMPKNPVPLFSLVPSFAAQTPQQRKAAAKKRREFIRAYYTALARYNDGERDVAFPPGTWFMRRRYQVNVELLDTG